MKHLTSILLIIFCTLLIACGGGGGGGSSTSGGGIGPFTSLRLEARLNGTTTLIDPSNIFLSESVQFVLTGIDNGAVGTPRIVLNTSGWSLTGSPGGTVTSAGLYSGSSTPSPSTGTVSVTYSSLNFSAGVRVVQPQAILTGKIRLTSGLGVSRLKINALDASANIVASGLSAADGTIRMSVPTNATKFTVDFSVADPLVQYYVRQFAYRGSDYSPGISGCTAPMPTLTNLAVCPLLGDIVVYASADVNPPPPPNGC